MTTLITIDNNISSHSIQQSFPHILLYMPVTVMTVVTIITTLITLHNCRDVARNFEFRPFGPNSPKLLGPLKKIRPLYLVHINTHTLYFYTQCVT